jgi:hypothetical protein
MSVAVKSLVAVLALAFVGVTEAKAQHLVGKDRADFIAGVLKTCNSDQSKNASLSGIPASVIDQLCRCYASGLADRLTVDQLRASDAVVDPIVKSTMGSCYQTIKSDIQRYRGYGK